MPEVGDSDWKHNPTLCDAARSRRRHSNDRPQESDRHHQQARREVSKIRKLTHPPTVNRGRGAAPSTSGNPGPRNMGRFPQRQPQQWNSGPRVNGGVPAGQIIASNRYSRCGDCPNRTTLPQQPKDPGGPRLGCRASARRTDHPSRAEIGYVGQRSTAETGNVRASTARSDKVTIGHGVRYSHAQVLGRRAVRA